MLVILLLKDIKFKSIEIEIFFSSMETQNEKGRIFRKYRLAGYQGCIPSEVRQLDLVLKSFDKNEGDKYGSRHKEHRYDERFIFFKAFQ